MSSQEIPKYRTLCASSGIASNIQNPLKGVHQVCGVLSTVGLRKDDLSCIESAESSSKYPTQMYLEVSPLFDLYSMTVDCGRFSILRSVSLHSNILNTNDKRGSGLEKIHTVFALSISYLHQPYSKQLQHLHSALH